MTIVSRQFIIDLFQKSYQKQFEKQIDSGLKQLMQKCWDVFFAKGLPDSQQEDWRYCNFTKAYQTLVDSPTLILKKKSNEFFKVEGGSVLTVVNGKLAGATVNSNISVQPLINVASEDKIKFINLINERIEKEENPFALYNMALISEALVIKVKGNERQKLQIILENQSASLNCPFIYLIAEPNSELDLVISERNIESSSSLCSNMILLHVKSGANVHVDMIAEKIEESFVVNQLRFIQEKNSKVACNSYFTGSVFSRLDFAVDLVGEGSEFVCHHLCINSLERQQHYFARVKHWAQNCKSSQLFKNILADKSEISTDATIVVARGAKLTQSDQLVNNLFLSDKAKSNTKPNLSIYHEDVKCKHGATSGSIDLDSLFYLKSRGLSDLEARVMIVQSFADEICESFKDEQLKTWLRQKVANELFEKR